MSVSPVDGFLLESHPILLCVTSTIPDVHTQDPSFANETTRLNEVPITNKLQTQVEFTSSDCRYSGPSTRISDAITVRQVMRHCQCGYPGKLCYILRNSTKRKPLGIV